MAQTKKETILSTAARLFAQQGFEDTTTLQIANEAGVTEPLLYYHFQGKEEIFSIVIRDFFTQYRKLIDGLSKKANTGFEKLAELIRVHLEIPEYYPHETNLVLSVCPAMLFRGYPVCREVLEEQRKILDSYLEEILQEGVESGEFRDCPLAETVAVLRCFVNGIFRNKLLQRPDEVPNAEAAVAFCRYSLLK